MAYQALYRKFRPRRFDDVVGQSHITTIIKNQIQSGHTAHAYLFCGSRGTGKTSTAKIFAQAVNCLHPSEGEACGECEACSLMKDGEVDIIEIDAASNNGVDDMRALIEQARFMPLQLPYKVYIIDEVHMLSSNASNALLKTLEEPPQHVKFLLATTEPQKILPTVISRCQRFDFKRLTMADMVRTMRGILADTGFCVEEGGLYVIARAADGGMRDALSLLDQCLAFCGKTITEQDVYDVLGSMDSAFLFEMAEALIASNAPLALRMMHDLLKSGRNLHVFMQDLAQHIRALMLARVCGDCVELLECTPEIMEIYQQQSARVSEERLLRALEWLTKAQSEMKWASQPEILAETALVRICRPEDEESLLALQDRVTRLETQKSVIQAESAPPWDEEPQKGPVIPERAKPPAGEGKAELAMPKADGRAKAQPEAQAESAPRNAAEAGSIHSAWEAMRKAMQKQHASLYVLSAGASSAEPAGDKLVVVFPKAKEAAVRALSNQRSLDTLAGLLREVEPKLRGIEIVVQRGVNAQPPSAREPVEKEENALKEIFGDKFSIQE